MEKYIKKFSNEVIVALKNLPVEEIAKALDIIQATYERDGRIYIFGNGGSLALATHWVSDFNKTVFSHHLDEHSRRFQAIRLPSTESELTAWANDIGYDMVFAGPLKNYIKENDTIIAKLGQIREYHQGRRACAELQCLRHRALRFRWRKAPCALGRENPS